MPYFAVSSGTTSGKVKHIPCSVAMARANQKAALDTLSHHLGHTPDSRLLDGPFFMLGGSTDLKELAPGVLAGDISGIAAHRRPWWSRPYHFPPRELRFITDWEEKIARMAPLSLERAIRGLSGAPGWLLVLFERLASLRPHTPAASSTSTPTWSSSSTAASASRPTRRASTRCSRARRSGRARSTPRRRATSPSPTAARRGHAPRGRQRHVLRVRAGRRDRQNEPDPALGRRRRARRRLRDRAHHLRRLWSYLIGDVVRFVDTRPPRLLIVGRTSYMLSSFGEHLTGELVETCVLAAARQQGLDVAEFAVGTQFGKGRGEWGRHAYVVEFVGPRA
jgi:hypothetical protein